MQTVENLKDITSEIKNEFKKNECKDIGKVNKPINSSIAGKKFNNLTALQFVKREKRDYFWLCRCVCGKEIIVRKSGLGKKISCGCVKSNHRGRNNRNFIDLTGKKIGNFIVKNFIENPKGILWNCQCVCGKEIPIKASILSRNLKKSCGCLPRTPKSKFDNDGNPIQPKTSLIGRKFTRLLVINFYKNINDENYWECKCDCGNIKYVTTRHLNYEHVRSCGCLNLIPDKENLINQKFGTFTVFDKVYKKYKNYGVWKWRCICDCGYIKDSSHRDLLKKKRCNYCIDRRGELNPNYNSNLTEEERNKERNLDPKNKEWVKSVYKRDCYKCAITGAKGKINAHHYKNYCLSTEDRYNLDNGITILESIHEYFHRLYGYRNNTKEQFDEFVKNLTEEEKQKLILKNNEKKYRKRRD